MVQTSEPIDNGARRVRTLKGIVRDLNAGQSPAAVEPCLGAFVKECDAPDVAAMKQELTAEGVPITQIMSMSDFHAAVERGIPCYLVQPEYSRRAFARMAR